MARIIVIEDEPALRRGIVRALRAAGHAVSAYADGRGALAEIEKDAVDLLITDIFMPEVEGLETIRNVRARRPDLPIIAISGVSFEGADYLQMAQRFGAAAALQKPFRPAELLGLVERLLAGRSE